LKPGPPESFSTVESLDQQTAPAVQVVMLDDGRWFQTDRYPRGPETPRE
jgi:hypothetical protein